MRKTFLIFSILFLMVAGLAAKTNDKIKSSDGIVTVQAMKDGLHITKKHNPKFVHVTLKVSGAHGENFSISTDEKQNNFVYPFVEAGSTYKVYLVMMDKNWGNWTQSQPAIIEAIGGAGDCYSKCSMAHYDNDSMSIVMDDFVFQKPQNVTLLSQYLSGNIYYNQQSGNINWSNATWGRYPVNGNKVDISNRKDFIINSSFFIQLTSQFTYEGVSFQTTLISNEKSLYTDSHPVTNVVLSDGVLVPPFNPGIKNYEIRGTNNKVIITPEYAKNIKAPKDMHTVGPNAKQDSITINLDGKDFTYSFTYAPGTKINFQGKEYIQTFFDDFEGKELDLTKWSQSGEEERQGSMKNHGWWSNECSYLDGKGNLIIESKRSAGKNLSGAVQTQNLFEQSHGYYEVKFKCDKTSGLWYAFWLMGDNDDKHIGKGATDAAEIDIFELIPNEPYNGPNYFKTTIHWDGYGAAHGAEGSPSYNPDDSFYDQWHVAQFIWGQTSYDLYLDGNLLWSLDASEIDKDHFGGMCDGINFIIISAEFGDWGGPIDESLLPAKMYVDYVKVGL